jgi:hypothetical protein
MSWEPKKIFITKAPQLNENKDLTGQAKDGTRSAGAPAAPALARCMRRVNTKRNDLFFYFIS